MTEKLDPAIHKAEPAPEFADDGESVCIHCHTTIRRVPGGSGPVWIHASTQSVVGHGRSNR